MNPVILGAVIGAVPGTLAAALGTWAAVRSGKVNLSQTQLTLATEHQQWLRDRRSEIYVELLAHAEQLFLRRQTIVYRLGDVTDEDRKKVQAILDEYEKPESRELEAKADAFAPPDTAEMYGGMVRMMDFGFWAVVHLKMNDPACSRFEIDANVKGMLDYADEGLTILRRLAARDLQTAPLPNPAPQTVAHNADPFSGLRALVRQRAAISGRATGNAG